MPFGSNAKYKIETTWQLTPSTKVGIRPMGFIESKGYSSTSSNDDKIK